MQLRLSFEAELPCAFGFLDDPREFHHCAACAAEVERMVALA